MTAILQTIFSDDFSLMKKKRTLIKTSLYINLVPKGQIDNNPALVLIIAWRRKEGNPLSEPMPTQFTNACMQGWLVTDGVIQWDT